MTFKYLSAIDIGTNSFHLIIVRVNSKGKFKVIDREKVVIRLGGHEGRGLSLITEEEMKTGIKTIKKFKALADFYNAPLKAVATSAVREAKNKNEFLEIVKDKTGVGIEVIEGHREAELIYKGVQYAVPILDKRALCIDIGGGSTEFLLGNKGKPVFAESIKIGAVRLSKKFFPDFVISEKKLKDCSEYIEEQILANKKINLKEKFDLAVGSSGTILAAAGLIHYRKMKKVSKSLNRCEFTKEELIQVSEYVLSKKTFEDRLKIRGMERKRADIIPAGFLILLKIFELFNLEKITVSENALRSGIIIEELYNSNIKPALK